MREEIDLLRYKRPRQLKSFAWVALAVAGLIVVFGVVTRLRAYQDEAAWTAARAIPTVQLITLGNASKDAKLILPGAVQAFSEAPIHARVSGYLKRWYADIGTPVKAGQVLAEIDTPDVDQQLAQAKADLANASASQTLAASTAKRWNELLVRNAVSQQDVDEKAGDLAAKNAVLASAQANENRLATLESFKHIVAPFNGIVTTRSIDVGALVSIGSPGDTPLFTVADENRLRIYVRVPQNYSSAIRQGMTANFTVPEYPGRAFKATIASTSGAIDPKAGTLLVQLQTDNADHALKPGSYAQVQLELPVSKSAVRLPASALMLRDVGTSVAMVDENNHVVVKPVNIARDFGATVEIDAGVKPSDRVIDNPPDGLRAGDEVRVKEVAPRK